MPADDKVHAAPNPQSPQKKTLSSLLLEKPYWMLDPRSKFMGRWDIIIACLLIYVATVTPYEVGFLKANLSNTDGVVLWCINRLVDLFFVVDIVFNFNTGYLDQSLGSGTYVWVFDRSKIAWKYVTGMFVLDIVSILPFDSLGILVDESFAKLKALRIVRLCRLLKLIRILKSGRILARFEQSINIDYNLLTLVKFISMVLVLSHWQACLFKLLADIAAGTGDMSAQLNWLTTYFHAFHRSTEVIPPLCADICAHDLCDREAGESCSGSNTTRFVWVYNLADQWSEDRMAFERLDCAASGEGYKGTSSGAGFIFGEDNGPQAEAEWTGNPCRDEDYTYFNWLQVGAGTAYIAALYWALVTMTTIGYGDITPTSTVERVYIIWSMILGTTLFAYIVGSVCGIVSNMDKRNNEFHELMDNLNEFMREARLPFELRLRLREFYRYKHRNSSIEGWQGMLASMSPKLRGEVAIEYCGNWIEAVPFFRGTPREFIIQLSLMLTSETFPRNEEIIEMGEIASKMYIVERGVVGGKGRVFTTGKVFGEDVLAGEVASDFCARAMTYVDLFSMSRNDIQSVLPGYPMVAKRLREAACKKMGKDSVVAFTKAYREIETLRLKAPFGDAALSDEQLGLMTPGRAAVARQRRTVFSFALKVHTCTGESAAGPQLQSIPGAETLARPPMGAGEQPLSPGRLVAEELGEDGSGGGAHLLAAMQALGKKLDALATATQGVSARLASLESEVKPGSAKVVPVS